VKTRADTQPRYRGCRARDKVRVVKLVVHSRRPAVVLRFIVDFCAEFVQAEVIYRNVIKAHDYKGVS